MDDLIFIFSVWVIAIVYILDLVMWEQIGRAAMNVFLPENTNFFFMRSTDPLVKVFVPITPGFLIWRLVTSYVACLIFMFGFYIMPWKLGRSMMGMLSLPTEGEISAAPYDIFSTIRTVPWQTKLHGWMQRGFGAPCQF
jgi:hypothetical protein